MNVPDAAEIIKGLTDLPLAIIAGVFFILLKKRGAGRDWTMLFFYIFIAGLLGCVAHSFTLGKFSHRALWLLLFPVMFELVTVFTELVYELDGDGEFLPEKLRRTEMIFLVIAEVLTVAYFRAAIYSFAAYGAVLAFYLIWLVRNNKKLAERLLTPTVLIVAALVLQIFKAVIPGGTAVAHILLCVALFFTYRLAE